jgi:hypothetical protein
MAINCKTPGLHIEWLGINGLYAYVVHTASNKRVKALTSKPIEGGKRRFAAAVDAALGDIDWNRTEAELVADAANIITKVQKISYDCR